MRPSYQPCEQHQRTYCTDSKCRTEETDTNPTSNVGSVSLNSDGNLSIGIGGGLAIDPSDGSIGIQVGGFTIDTA